MREVEVHCQRLTVEEIQSNFSPSFSIVFSVVVDLMVPLQPHTDRYHFSFLSKTLERAISKQPHLGEHPDCNTHLKMSLGTWTTADHLKLNLNKTKLLLMPGKECPHMVTVKDIAVSPSPTARNLVRYLTIILQICPLQHPQDPALPHEGSS